MKILVACEESQAVTREFRRLGHEAYSCDIIPTSGNNPEWHLQQDVIPLLDQEWDMIIAFPPCTYLTVSGARWFYHPNDSHLPTDKRRVHPSYPDRKKKQEKAIEFFMRISNSTCEMIAIENPVGKMSSAWRKPDQIIKPHYFGENSTKKTCLWLKGLPDLIHTDVIEPEVYISESGRKWDKWFFESSLISDLKERSLFRSKTFPGIAKAMAEQWGSIK